MIQKEFTKRYQFNIKQDKIGGGSFGTVYKAYDNVLDREVAIKVSEVKYVGSKEFSLLEEFKAIENLPPHKNIANYEEVFRFESFNGIYDYGIMQYYPLGNLSHYLKKNEVSQEVREELVLGVLEGIAYLHQHKVVHRDLKPSNILLVDRRGELIPKITDFGLSKQTSTEAKGSRFTNSFTGGTLQYSSPEQIKGEDLKLNTDLWSFGVIAFEILTGKTLFETEGDNLASADWQKKITEKILRGKIGPLLKVLPVKWQDVVASCLNRDLNKRAKNTDELFLKLIGEIEKSSVAEAPVKLSNDPTIIVEKKPEEDVEKPKPKSNKTKWIVMVIVGLLVVVAGVFGYTKLMPNEDIQALQLFEQDDLYGYKQGDSIIINPQFIKAANFTDNKAKVSTADSTFYIDNTGKWVLSFIEEEPKTEIVKTKENNTKKEVPLTEAQKADQQAWAETKRKDTKKAYQDYLNQYNKGSFRSKAQKAIAKIDKATTDKKEQDRLAETEKSDQQAWETANKEGAKKSYEDYLDKYPEGKFKSQAQKAITTINESTSTEEKKKEGASKQKLKVNISLVYIQGGTFTMGCTSEQSNCYDNEKPEHQVTVNSFRLSKYEITKAQFSKFIEDTDYITSSEKGGKSWVYNGSEWVDKPGVNWRHNISGTGDQPNNHPVIHVSWQDAQAFASWVGGRLPTEAEWEFAARGGNKSQGFRYSGNNNIGSVAWYGSNSNKNTHPVGQKQANELGLYDMTGNVWEWCSDRYGEEYYSSSPSTNPKGVNSGSYRVLRGGSWFGNDNVCRVTKRDNSNPTASNDDYGFRVVLY